MSLLSSVYLRTFVYTCLRIYLFPSILACVYTCLCLYLPVYRLINQSERTRRCATDSERDVEIPFEIKPGIKTTGVCMDVQCVFNHNLRNKLCEAHCIILLSDLFF